MSKFWNKLSDITHLHKRAAFSDLPERIAAKESVFMGIAKGRFSCRKFKNTPLTDAQIKHILEAARLAPSAKNNQPVHVWVISTEEALSRIRIVHSCYDAPVVLMVGYKASEAWVRPVDGKNSAEVDAAIVGTHMMLAATDQELDSVWIGSFDPAPLHELFPETEGYEIAFLLPVGHAAAHAEPSSMHAERQDLASFATQL